MRNSTLYQTASDIREIRALEEEWMNSGADSRMLEAGSRGESESIRFGPLEYNSDYQTPLGSYEDLFKGVIMGFFLGFIMLLWVR